MEEDVFVHCSKLGKKVAKDIASILKKVAYDSQVVIVTPQLFRVLFTSGNKGLPG